MARVALLVSNAGTAAALRAAAVGHEIVDANASAVDLVVSDGETPAAIPGAALLRTGSDLDGTPQPGGWRRVLFVKKPISVEGLRLAIRDALDAGTASSGSSTGEPWLREPRVAAGIAGQLADASRLRRPILLVGEPGSGTDEVAAALLRLWCDVSKAAIWRDEESFAAVEARLGAGDGALWAASLDRRDAGAQRDFERFLILAPARRCLVTAESVEALPPSLRTRLAALSLRLPPLRERRDAIFPLAEQVAADLAEELGGGPPSFDPSAREVLEGWDWPGNVVELEALVVRSLLARGVPAGERVTLTAADLRFREEPEAAVASLAVPVVEGPVVEGPVDAEPAAARRGVVVALTRSSDIASATLAQAAASTQETTQPSGAARDAEVESLLAAFAHDIRNPMSAIKTYATLCAANEGAGEGSLGALATAACERIDEQLEFLQRYAELDVTPSGAATDAVETLSEAIDAATGPVLHIEARRALPTTASAAVTRFIADAVVAEAASRRADGEEATADLGKEPGTIELRIPTGAAAVDRLGKWVQQPALPWRLALARDAARRSGGDLRVEVEDGELRLHWRLPAVEAEEEASHGQQAHSPDRRRRSRSS